MGVIAESEWRGGEQKKLEFCKVDMPTDTDTVRYAEVEVEVQIHAQRRC